MLIKQEEVIELLYKHNIKCKGVLHIGAHECEELGFYERLGVSKTNMVWIDAMDAKVKQATDRGIPNVFKAVITDKDNDTVKFNHTNNVQSSSVLEFGTHATEHPQVVVINSTQETTTTLDTFLREKQLDPTLYEFWNFDIQGAELMALKGATQALQYAKILYLEVNIAELYKGCALMSEIDEFLNGYGFTRVHTNMTSHGWGDAIYIRQVPKLSLCIPTMNRFSFLEKNIPQYLANPYIDEIVICDETGADCVLLAKQFTDPKLKLFTNSERLGAFRNKEQTVLKAKNKWVVLIDSDNFAPITYFDAFANYIANNPMTPSTIYAPGRTKATHNHGGFDYSYFFGKTLTNANYKTYKNQSIECLESLINTGNYIFNREFYLKSSYPQYSNLFNINAWEAKLRTWLLLNHGGTYVFPEGLEYYHSIHDGSLYMTTATEIDSYRSTVTKMYDSF
jgi:hypothetical protein